MALLLYLPGKKESGARLRKVVEDAVLGRETEVYRSIRKLSERFHKPIFDIHVAVFLAATKKDLNAILGFIDVLLELRTVLILPDADADTMTKAHRLRPRFVTWENDDFNGVRIIVKRLMDLHGRPIAGATQK